MSTSVTMTKFAFVEIQRHARNIFSVFYALNCNFLIWFCSDVLTSFLSMILIEIYFWNSKKLFWQTLGLHHRRQRSLACGGRGADFACPNSQLWWGGGAGCNPPPPTPTTCIIGQTDELWVWQCINQFIWMFTLCWEWFEDKIKNPKFIFHGSFKEFDWLSLMYQIYVCDEALTNWQRRYSYFS